MRMQRVVAGVLVTLACELAGVYLWLPTDVMGQAPVGIRALGVFMPPTPPGGQPIPLRPLPPPPVPPDLVPLTPEEKIGKFMIFDTTLSQPLGYACTTCHILDAGNTGPSSEVNEFAGTMPGVVQNRWSNRKPQTYGYAAFSPNGPIFNNNLGVWLGGTFWDGRTVNLVGQAQQPPINPNEMANVPGDPIHPVGPYPPLFGGFSPLLVGKLRHRPYTPMLLQVWGQDVFKQESAQQIYIRFAQALAAIQGSGEVCQFSSRYDASIYGTPPPPPQNQYILTASEERGRILYGAGPNPTNDPNFGKAQCVACHDSTALSAMGVIHTEGKNTFTMYCYANIGVPKNVNNHFYLQTDCASNPFGCNSLGSNYIDYGLGSNPNPAPDGTRFFKDNPGDIPMFRGLFKAPPNRNVDRRPSPDFVKAYMHNGVFTSLEDVVHFYNTRNLTTQPGEVIDFTKPNPYAGLVGTPLWPTPEVLENLQNAAGLTPAEAAAMGVAGNTPTNGQVGNLQLTPQEEADIVNFLKILSDGFTAPKPVPNPFGNP
jgi:cytochrome c peroxidase